MTRRRAAAVSSLAEHRAHLRLRSQESAARDRTLELLATAGELVCNLRLGVRLDTREAREQLWRDLDRLVLSSCAASDAVLELWLARDALEGIGGG